MSPRDPAPRHGCPGGCGQAISRHMLACREDWYRLPMALRLAVNESWRSMGSRRDAHRAAVADALAWYRANPRTVSTP